jgi:hypothetical protein
MMTKDEFKEFVENAILNTTAHFDEVGERDSLVKMIVTQWKQDIDDAKNVFDPDFGDRLTDGYYRD